eukprot:1138300-Pelagomonas_calceolata.AAC.8
MTIEGPQVTLLASELHPGTILQSQQDVFVISTYIANVLPIQQQERRRSKIELFGTPCAGISLREMAEIV